LSGQLGIELRMGGRSSHAFQSGEVGTCLPRRGSRGKEPWKSLTRVLSGSGILEEKQHAREGTIHLGRIQGRQPEDFPDEETFGA